MPKSEQNRIIRSNDGEVIYNITVEVLDALGENLLYDNPKDIIYYEDLLKRKK
jgi:hypothetical protein